MSRHKRRKPESRHKKSGCPKAAATLHVCLVSLFQVRGAASPLFNSAGPLGSAGLLPPPGAGGVTPHPETRRGLKLHFWCEASRRRTYSQYVSTCF